MKTLIVICKLVKYAESATSNQHQRKKLKGKLLDKRAEVLQMPTLNRFERIS